MRKFFFRLITDEKDTWEVKPLKMLLWILSFFYGYGLQIKRLLYLTKVLPRNRLPKPVISVGNITWGGVGKTPLVILIAELVKARGLKPAVLLRGYMDKKNVPSRKTIGQVVVSDEAEMLRKRLKDTPVLTGPKRYQNALQYLTQHDADIFILDDGFQHWPLHRDLDIVALDTTNPWGNGYLLPRGILREPIPSLKRADLLVLTKTDLSSQAITNIKSRIKGFLGDAPLIETYHSAIDIVNTFTGEHQPLAALNDKEVCTLCGIGDPASFHKILKKLNVRIKKSFTYPDHYFYVEGDIGSLIEYCRFNHVSRVVTTEKDAVKLIKFQIPQTIELLALRIEVLIQNGKELFLERINSLFPR